MGHSDREQHQASRAQWSEVHPEAVKVLPARRRPGALHLLATLAATSDQAAKPVQRPTSWLAREMGTSPSTVKRRRRDVEGAGVVVVERQRHPDQPKRNLPNTYHLRCAPGSHAGQLLDERLAAAHAKRQRSRAGRYTAPKRPEHEADPLPVEPVERCPECKMAVSVGHLRDCSRAPP